MAGIKKPAYEGGNGESLHKGMSDIMPTQSAPIPPVAAPGVSQAPPGTDVHIISLMSTRADERFISSPPRISLFYPACLGVWDRIYRYTLISTFSRLGARSSCPWEVLPHGACSSHGLATFCEADFLLDWASCLLIHLTPPFVLQT